MKTLKSYLVLFLTCLLGSGSLYSQYWETVGNPAGSGDFLGTTNNQALNFKTNNAFRMRLMNNTGYLGVGSQTFTPSASLHLNLLSYSINSRSEEHTSELQSRPHLVCRLLLEKK